MDLRPHVQAKIFIKSIEQHNVPLTSNKVSNEKIGPLLL